MHSTADSVTPHFSPSFEAPIHTNSVQINLIGNNLSLIILIHISTKAAGTAESVQRLCTGLHESGLETTQGQEVSIPSQKSELAVGPTQSPIRWALGSFRGLSDRGAMSTAYPHLVQRLRMSGDTVLLSLHNFKAWIGKILLLVCHFRKKKHFHRIGPYVVLFTFTVFKL